MGQLSQLMALLAQQGNGGAQGFSNPGNGAPQLPGQSYGQQQAGGLAPQIPQMQRQGTQQGGMMPNMPQGSTTAPQSSQGVFAGLQNNPYILAMLKQRQQQGASSGNENSAATNPNSMATWGQSNGNMNPVSSAQEGPFSPNQPAPNGQAQSGIQAFLAHLFSGGSVPSGS